MTKINENEIADWENDPAYMRLKAQYDNGEISREDFLHFGYVFMQAQMALGPERWKLLNGAILPGTEPDITEALAILNDRAGPPK
jgi:hypothetical protein